MKLNHLLIIYFLFLPLKSFADGQQVLKIARPLVVFINGVTDNGMAISGSGVIVASNEILTNCHVVENVKNLKVRFNDKQEVDASLKGKVANLDLCAIQADTGTRNKASIISLSEVKEGQPIYTVGNPLSLNATISSGIISGLRQTENGKLIQISAPISHGSSGGGLFDSKGRLIGITTFTLTNGQNINFAIPAEYKNSLGIATIQNTEENTNVKTGKVITFKGVSFGSSSKKFTEVFNDASCEDTPMGIMCRGGRFSYLNLYAQSYMAFFKNDKLQSVSVIFNKSDSFSVTEDLKKSIIGYFGQPNGSIQTENQTSWEPNPSQSIELDNCEKGGFLCPSWAAAKVNLTDRNIIKEKVKSDF